MIDGRSLQFPFHISGRWLSRIISGNDLIGNFFLKFPESAGVPVPEQTVTRTGLFLQQSPLEYLHENEIFGRNSAGTAKSKIVPGKNPQNAPASPGTPLDGKYHVPVYPEREKFFSP
jgi:hypothetical protein